MKFVMYADGGSRGNPGNAGAGAFVLNEKKERVVTVSEFLGVATNNIAEYTAVIRGLEKLTELLRAESQHSSVDVRLDSQLIVRQMNGEYKIKHPNIIPLANRVKEVCKSFASVTFTHVFREDNKQADALANQAMDRGFL